MISFPNFNVYLKKHFTKVNNSKAYSGALTFNSANLAPLANDTLSFTGKRKVCEFKGDVLALTPSQAKVGKQNRADKAIFDFSDKANFKVAKSLYDESEFAHNRFKSDISQIFGGIPVLDAGSLQFKNVYEQNILDNLEAGKPILAITARRKSPESIAEKMSSKGIKSKKAAKEQISDFSGIRIILSGKNKDDGNYVLNKLADAVKGGWISISEIEVFHNPELKPSNRYSYANDASLRKVEAAARKQGIKDFKLVAKSTESGYPAIHMLVNFPDNTKGELQIIGLNVLNLKEIEDLCYKVLTNKKLDAKYSDIETLLEQVRDNPEEYRDFMEYTRKAYALERKKELGLEPKDSKFLKLQIDTEVPDELDFNHIPDMKRKAEMYCKARQLQEVLMKYNIDEASIKLHECQG